MENAVNEKLEEDLVGANVVNYRGLCGTAAIAILDFDGEAGAIEALVVLVSGEGVESISAVADQVPALGRVANDEDMERPVVNGGAYRMDSRAAVCTSRCEESKARTIRS